MKLTRPARANSLISLVPMIDVLLILLVFFMVTSTYLNLDMIPARQPEETGTAGVSAATKEATILIRLDAEGRPVLGGQVQTWEDLHRVLSQRLETDPLAQVLVLPSGLAKTQALINVLDIAAQTGVQRLRVFRMDAQP